MCAVHRPSSALCLLLIYVINSNLNANITSLVTSVQCRCNMQAAACRTAECVLVHTYGEHCASCARTLHASKHSQCSRRCRHRRRRRRQSQDAAHSVDPGSSAEHEHAHAHPAYAAPLHSRQLKPVLGAYCTLTLTHTYAYIHAQ